MSLTASDFQDPLLRVLYVLANGIAGVPTPAEDTYPVVMDLMDIEDVGAYGINDASGQPQVVKWIQWANTNCRKAGLTENLGRGKWSLTDEGIRVAGALAKAALAVPEDGAGSDTDSSVSDDVFVAARQEVYHTDPYVVSVAADTVRCFGSYSGHGNSACQACPLQTHCRTRMYAILSRMAANLADKPDTSDDEADDTATPTQGSARTPASKVDWKAAWANKTANKIRVRGSALQCECCGDEVAEGEDAVWIDGLDDSSGVYHTGCSEMPS